MSQFLDQFLEANPDIDEATAKQLREVGSSILAGMDQMRTALGLKMGDIKWPRMGQLADRLAVETVDWTLEESFLIGSYIAASARAQLVEREG